MTRRASVIAFLAMGLLAGCTGTDMVDEDDGPDGEGRVEITPGAMALIVGDTFTYSARYLNEEDVEVGVSFTWTSSEPGVADVSNGTVSAIAPGQAEIQAEAGGVRSEAVTVTVVQDEEAVAYVVISPTTASTSEQGQVQFSAETTNIDGGSVDTDVTWSVSDQQVASIDADGLATGLATGTTGVIATAEGVASPAAMLTIEGESKSGTFQGAAGTSYSASGTAVLMQGAGGDLRLEFNDDFSVDDGPGLEVFLSNTPGVTAESFNVGPIQGISGAQSYQVAGSVTLDSYTHVVIHCVPFNVTFAAAALN